MSGYITTEFLCWGIIALLSVMVYFIKKIFDKTEKIETIESALKEIKTKFGILWEKSLTIEKDVKTHDRDIVFLKGKSYATSNSPLELNEDGERVLKESKINAIIDDRGDELVEKIKQTNPETLYDAQITAQNILEAIMKESHNILLAVKNGAYNSGVDIDIVVFVGSLYLRDKYIAKYPNNK